MLPGVRNPNCHAMHQYEVGADADGTESDLLLASVRRYGSSMSPALLT